MNFVNVHTTKLLYHTNVLRDSSWKTIPSNYAHTIQMQQIEVDQLEWFVAIKIISTLQPPCNLRFSNIWLCRFVKATFSCFQQFLGLSAILVEGDYLQISIQLIKQEWGLAKLCLTVKWIDQGISCLTLDWLYWNILGLGQLVVLVFCRKICKISQLVCP